MKIWNSIFIEICCKSFDDDDRIRFESFLLTPIRLVFEILVANDVDDDGCFFFRQGERHINLGLAIIEWLHNAQQLESRMKLFDAHNVMLSMLDLVMLRRKKTTKSQPEDI